MWPPYGFNPIFDNFRFCIYPLNWIFEKFRRKCVRLRPERAKIFCLCALQLSWRKLCTQKNRRNSPAGEIERCTKNTIFFVSFARTAIGSKTDLQIWHFFCAKSRYRHTGVTFFVKKCRNFDQKTRNFIIKNSTRAVRASKHPPLFHKSPRGPRTRGTPPTTQPILIYK